MSQSQENDAAKSHSTNQTSLEERRKAERQHAESDLEVKVETTSFGGRTENISPAGVLFFSGDELRVRVEVQEDGERKTYNGRLARVARMSDSETGFAIEFDRA